MNARVTLTLITEPKDSCLTCTRPGKWLVGDPKAKRRACGLHVDAIATTVATMIKE